MIILKTKGWEDYELLDSGDGFRIERFGKFVLKRPDPQIIWKTSLTPAQLPKIDAVFQRTEEDHGFWRKASSIPDKWLIHYQDLCFYAKLSPFKHTGIFPEQSVHWDWIKEKIVTASQRSSLRSEASGSKTCEANILNLFGYTGIASLVAAWAGAKVTHIDASKPTLTWARENQLASGLEDKPIRWIPDDAIKFVTREIKRGVKYDGIIMDPPIFGHGPEGQVWKFNQSFPKLLSLCAQVLSPQPLFVIANAYAISSSAIMLQNLFQDCFGKLGGTIESGELALEEKSGGRLFSTGIFARWSK